MGFTSREKMVQMGVHDMIWGRLTDRMIVEDGGTTSFKTYVHPRIEPEIAFLLKRELVGTITPVQALSAVEAVAPAVELIDSRYQAFKFSLTDVVATTRRRPDSSSGQARPISTFPIRDIVVQRLAGPRRVHGGDSRPSVALAGCRRALCSRSGRASAAGMAGHGGWGKPCRSAQAGTLRRMRGAEPRPLFIQRWGVATMPIAIIHLMEGRDDKKKARAIEAVTKALVESLDAKPETVRVILLGSRPTGDCGQTRRRASRRFFGSELAAETRRPEIRAVHTTLTIDPSTPALCDKGGDDLGEKTHDSTIRGRLFSLSEGCDCVVPDADVHPRLRQRRPALRIQHGDHGIRGVVALAVRLHDIPRRHRGLV
jgi:2-oxo-3-hexenedioate decarboxylase